MSSSRKILLLMIIVIFIIVVTLCILLLYRTNTPSLQIDETGDTAEVVIQKEVQRVKNRNDYNAIETCVNKYYMYYSAIYNNTRRRI